MIGRRVAGPTDPQFRTGPLERQLREYLADPSVAAGIAEEDQVAAADVVFGDGGIVLDRQFATEVTMPFVGEAFQVGLSPSLNGGVPGLASAANTQERRGEGVIDRPLQSRPFPFEIDRI